MPYTIGNLLRERSTWTNPFHFLTLGTMAVAEASFNTAIDSISDGLMVANGFAPGPGVSTPPIMTPSVTYKGTAEERQMPMMKYFLLRQEPAQSDEIAITPSLLKDGENVFVIGTKNSEGSTPSENEFLYLGSPEKQHSTTKSSTTN